MKNVLGFMLVTAAFYTASSAAGEEINEEEIDVSTDPEITEAQALHGDAQVTKLLVTITRIEVYSRTGHRWITVADYDLQGREFDLMTMQNGSTEELGAFDLPPDSYSAIRLHTRDHAMEIDEGHHHGHGHGHDRRARQLSVPWRRRGRIDLAGHFSVAQVGITTVTVDFNPRRSIFHHSRHGYMFYPVIRITGASTAQAATKLIRAETGGEVHLIGRASLKIPAHALAADTEITIGARAVEERIANKLGMLPGKVLELGPDGLTFNHPAELVHFFDPDVVAEGMLDELTVLSANGRSAWTELPSTLSSRPSRLTTAVDHFSNFVVGYLVKLICPPGYVRDDDTSECSGSGTQVFNRNEGPRSLTYSLYIEDGTSVDVRQVFFTFTGGPLVSVGTQAGTNTCEAPTTEGACEALTGCGWDDNHCVVNPRFVTVKPEGCGAGTLEARTQNAVNYHSFRVNFRVRMTIFRIGITENGDSAPADGEIYWRFVVNGVTVSDHPNPTDVGDRGHIALNDSAVIGDFDSLDALAWFTGILADEDDELAGEDNITGISLLIRVGTSPNQHVQGGEPGGDINWWTETCVAD